PLILMSAKERPVKTRPTRLPLLQKGKGSSLRSHPHPALRATFSRTREKGCSAGLSRTREKGCSAGLSRRREKGCSAGLSRRREKGCSVGLPQAGEGLATGGWDKTPFPRRPARHPPADPGQPTQ